MSFINAKIRSTGQSNESIELHRGNTIKLFDKGNKLTKDRFANLMSYMYSFLIAPKKFEEHMKFCYFTSKKITTDSSIYLIIQ